MQALFRLTLKDYDGEWSRREFLPYAIWHNQKTNQVTIHTETGYYKFPAHVIEKIELLQTLFEFTLPKDYEDDQYRL